LLAFDLAAPRVEHPRDLIDFGLHRSDHVVREVGQVKGQLDQVLNLGERALGNVQEVGGLRLAPTSNFWFSGEANGGAL
jgi:hypothetical protein